VVPNPRTTETVKSKSVTAPVPRSANQSGEGVATSQLTVAAGGLYDPPDTATGWLPAGAAWTEPVGKLCI
jgi:hypothetical protein